MVRLYIVVWVERIRRDLNDFSMLYIEKLFGVKNRFISAFSGEFLLFLPSSDLERVGYLLL